MFSGFMQRIAATEKENFGDTEVPPHLLEKDDEEDDDAFLLSNHTRHRASSNRLWMLNC